VSRPHRTPRSLPPPHGRLAALLLWAVLQPAALAADACTPAGDPSAATLRLRVETQEGHRTGSAAYLRSARDGRRYLATAYHLVHGATAIRAAGRSAALTQDLTAPLDRAWLLPSRDLAVFPCGEGCRAALEGTTLARRPLTLVDRPARFPAPDSAVAVSGNPRLRVLGHDRPLANVAVAATVLRYAPAERVLGRHAPPGAAAELLVLSDYAVAPGFSGGPVAWSASNFCRDAELAGVLQGGDPSRAERPSWAIPAAALRQAIAGEDAAPFPPARWPPPVFPQSVPAFAAERPFLELVDWWPRPKGDPETQPPALALPDGESVELAVVVRLGGATGRLVPRLNAQDWLHVVASPPVWDPGEDPLQRLAWRVRAGHDAWRAAGREGVTIRFLGENGPTDFSVELAATVVPGGDTAQEGGPRGVTHGDKSPVVIDTEGSVTIHIQ
jgi:hypothetical protein